MRIKKINKHIITLSLFVFCFLFFTGCVNAFPMPGDGHFVKLKGVMDSVPVYWSEDEVFLPGGISNLMEKSPVTGGQRPSEKVNSAKFYNIKTQTFRDTGAVMKIPRYFYAAIKLNDGRVLIIGGNSSNQRRIKSAEIYDPKTNSFELTQKPNFNYGSFHDVLELNDGRIFVFQNGQAEIFDPETEKFTVAGKKEDYTYTRNGGGTTVSAVKTTINKYADTQAVLLNDGRVLVTGTNYNFEPGFAEIYDPAANKFTLAANPHSPLFGRSAVTLNDGRVLVTGGNGERFSNVPGKLRPKIPAKEEIYNPETKKFDITGNLVTKRAYHDSILLENGKVLVVGGQSGIDAGWHFTRGAELYDPKTGRFKSIGRTKADDAFVTHLIDIGNRTIFISNEVDAGLYKY